MEDAAGGSAALATASGTESCSLSIDSDVVEVDSGAFDAGAVNALRVLSALDVVATSSTEALSAVPLRAAVASVSEAGLMWVSLLPTNARFAVAGDAGSEDVDVALDREPDADDPDDIRVDGDEDFAEPKERDDDSDPDDADEIVEDEAEEVPEDDVEASGEEFASFGSAWATPCPVNTAAPTPKATASPPTLPT